MRLAFVALLAASSPAATATAQVATPIDGVAMVREMTLDPTGLSGSTMELRYEAYVLFRGGISMRGIPAGAPSTWNADSLARALPQYAGRWSEVGRALHIVTTRGDVRDFKDWFRMTPGRTDEHLEGVWMRAGGITQQSMGRGSTASAVRQLALHANGRFEGTLSGGASTGGVVTATQRASAGRYRIDGFQVEFQFDDGQVLRQFFCASSDDHVTLLVGGARMSKRK